MTVKTEIEDALGEITSFSHAISMASSALSDTGERCAISALADEIKKRVQTAWDLMDLLPEDKP